MNLTIDGSLKRQVKARAALLDVTVSDVVTGLLTEWLKQTEKAAIENSKDQTE